MNDVATVWVNGKLIPADDLCVSPFDLGLSVGFGIFETMVAYEGVVFAIDRHLARLESGLEKLSLAVPDEEKLQAAVSQVISANQMLEGRARVRVSVSGGDNPLAGGKELGNVIVTAAPQPNPASFAKVIISPYTHNQNDALSGIKSASYAANLVAYRHAIAQGADEALVLNTSGNLCEATMSNLFVVRGDTVLTPPLTSGCLPGVTRAIVMEICESLQIPCEESDITEHELADVAEMFLTSSAREVQPATLDMAASECSGAVTTRIAAAYCERVRNEIGT